MRLSCLIIMMSAAVLATAADEPAGWSKARWGMNEAQLVQAFGTDANTLDPPEKVSGIPVTIAVPVELAGIRLRALMLPDKDGKLDSVLITPIRQADQTDGLYQDLQNLLVQKYGRPWKASEEMGVSELQWVLKSTVIILTRGKLPLTTQRIVNLQYKQKPADLDKI